MTESTSVHPTAVGVVGYHVPYRTPETELLKQWQHARDALSSSEMFEASAYLEMLSAARNMETDPDRLYRAVEHHTALSARIAAERSVEDGLRGRTRTALLRRVGETYLRLDAEAALAEEDAYEMQIARDIAARRALGGTIAKNGQAPQVMGGFTFVTWDDVGARVGTLLAEHGIVTLPSITTCEVIQAGTTANGKPIYRATVTLVYQFVNADEPSERTTVTWVGSGDDSGDKAIQKAATSGAKYLLLKLFMLGGADDAERNGEDARIDHPPAVTAPSMQRPTNGSKPKVVARTLTGRGCPRCGGDLEHVHWDNGGEKIACTNWRECKYRENVVPAPAEARS